MLLTVNYGIYFSLASQFRLRVLHGISIIIIIRLPQIAFTAFCSVVVLLLIRYSIIIIV